MHIEPCFCGNSDLEEFIVKKNKMTCLCCNTTRVSSTTRTTDEMIAVWNTRGVCPIDLNLTKADAISEMIGKMPSVGFDSEREKNNWIGDYIHELRSGEHISPEVDTESLKSEVLMLKQKLRKEASRNAYIACTGKSIKDIGFDTIHEMVFQIGTEKSGGNKVSINVSDIEKYADELVKNQ